MQSRRYCDRRLCIKPIIPCQNRSPERAEAKERRITKGRTLPRFAASKPFLVIDKRFCQLVGAGCAASALNTLQLVDYVVYFHADRKPRYALCVAAATVDEFQRFQNAVIHFENDLPTASAACSVRFHKKYSRVKYTLIYKCFVNGRIYLRRFFFPFLVHAFCGAAVGYV